MAITDTFSKTQTRSEKKADKKTRKKEEDEARSRFEDPQKIINQMKLKERPSYGQATNPLRAAAEKAVQGKSK